MDVFFTILERLIPLYLLILLGFFAGKFLKVKGEGIAAILIYIITPVVIFFGILSIDLNPSRLSLPLIFYSLCVSTSLIAYRIARRFFSSPTKNILAYAGGTGNNGYFGLPVAIFLFGPEVAGIVLISSLGFTLFDSTLGFYITARGRVNARQALIRVSRLPALYAGILAIILNVTHAMPKDLGGSMAISFRGTYTVLGMMMIGLGIASAERLRPDWRFTGMTFFTKFLLWPALMLTIIILDIHYFHFWDVVSRKIMILLSCVPLAANTVAFATILNTEPDKASMAVLLSTVFALFFIPVVMTIMNYFVASGGLF